MALVELTRPTHGQSISVRLNDEIVVRLPENPTTGYRWEIDQADPLIAGTADAFTLDSDPQFGSGGTRELRFRVTSSSGVGRLSLKYWQPWEGDASVSDRFSVELQVAE